MKFFLFLYAIIAFILLIGTTIVLAQEITGWISPSDLFTDSKWLPFFNKIAITESIGGNAGANSYGVNFYVDRKTGLIPLYEKNGVTRPLVGNIQSLPRNIAESPQFAGVTARVEITDWTTGKTEMTEIFKGGKALSPNANKKLLEGIVRYNLDPRNLGKEISVLPKKIIKPITPPKIGWFRKLFSKKIPPVVRPKIFPGVAVDPVGVTNLAFDWGKFYLAQKAANKCHRVVTGAIKADESDIEDCKKYLQDLEERVYSEFNGLDPLKQPGGDLFEVPEGYYKTWLGFYVRTPEKIEQDKRREEILRFN